MELPAHLLIVGGGGVTARYCMIILHDIVLYIV